LSSEIELRLERSFWDDTVMGGPEMHAAFRMMAAAATLVQSRIPVAHSKTWLEDPQIFQAVRQAWITIIDGLDPGGAVRIAEEGQGMSMDQLGLIDIIRQGMEYIPRPAPNRRSRNKKQPRDG
jgi:hypothetical protein